MNLDVEVSEALLVGTSPGMAQKSLHTRQCPDVPSNLLIRALTSICTGE